ncbi:CDP-glycerol glycerophosphotransferase family protein [Mumia sp. zg.B17]|uniref:CDP-glycerol glycerophosphotransferase family protein n=1 Tax=Mumia sp. zg.B17 TaxID=2855446 RepID=UPI001C6DFA6E|nr:CDP-glycerol glycerophosphotransferase family protein [Mumia sp. zg.B17]MBW9204495.1 CDP-glycerol glycerophosphotransferase family protein [Mumia sp. zg.B17]
MTWLTPTVLEVAGWVVLPGVAPTTDPRELAIWLTGAGRTRIEPTTLRQVQDARVAEIVDDVAADQRGSGFVARFDLGRVVQSQSRRTWRLVYRVRRGGIDRTGTFDARDRGCLSRAVVSDVVGGRRIRAMWNDGLVVAAVNAPVVLVELLDQEPRGAVLLLETQRRLIGASLVEVDGTARLDAAVVPGDARTAVVVPRDLPGGVRWDVRVTTEGGDELRVQWARRDGARISGVPGGISVARGARGYVELVREPVLEVARWRLEGDRLVMECSYADPVDGVEVFLRGPLATATIELSAGDGDTCVAVVDLRPSRWGRRMLLAPGRYLVVAEREGQPVPVAVGPQFTGDLADRCTDELRVRAEQTAKGQLRIVLAAPLADDERGAYAQRQLRRDYRARQGVEQIAYFECYGGTSATDSAAAIHTELRARRSPLRSYFGIAHRGVPVPPDATPVLRYTREWWEVVARSRFLTFNAGLPAGLERRDGQEVVQTWHGTPLKLLGYHRPATATRSEFPEQIRAYVSRWDHLLAPNPHSAAIFPEAWFYEGPIHQLGYPRNDALWQAPSARATMVRDRLGIAAGSRVVLYAPTWRDGSRTMPDLLDVERLAVALGPNYVVLVRGHMNIRRWSRPADGGQVRDVTAYPEINDLFLAADVLITDYSSVMFDYSRTGKPMVFFVPDYEHYRDERRGMYFDLAEVSPGPLVRSFDDVVAVLRDVASVHASHEPRYAAWIERFNPLDDGNAAARVVDAIYEY